MKDPHHNGQTTNELDAILQSGSPETFSTFLEDHQDQLIQDQKAFTTYMREHFKKNGLQQQDVFVAADIPERYGYKLISGEKHTRQRDILLRICLAAHFTLHETQTALKLYGMATLYARIPRDAALIIAFNTGLHSPYEADRLLIQNHLETLASCGETLRNS